MALSEMAHAYFISKYKEEYCQQLLEHCATGRSIESFAAKINSIPEALAYWANKYVDFEVCLRVAYWKSYAFWEDQMIDDQTRIKEFKTLNPSLLQLIMKNRFKWRDTADDLMIAVNKMSNHELEDRARKIIESRTKGEIFKEEKAILKIEAKK